jgi:hypothetical protein
LARACRASPALGRVARPGSRIIRSQPGPLPARPGNRGQYGGRLWNQSAYWQVFPLQGEPTWTQSNRMTSFCWLSGGLQAGSSDFPQDIQRRLFEQAVASQGEAIRAPLAVFFHETHTRTTDALKTNAIQEPDSLGG